MGRHRIRLAGSGSLEKQSWESTALLRIGRLENLEVILDDPLISRRHAEVEFTEEGWVVRDLGSTNGTFLNQVRVGRADQRLRQGDKLQCGNATLEVVVLEGNEPAATGPLANTLFIEHSTSHSWESAIHLCASNNLNQPEGRERLLELFRIGRDFGQVTSLDSLLNSVLEQAATTVKAHGGAILLIDESAGEQLKPHAFYPASSNCPTTRCYSRSLAQRTLCQGESLLCHDSHSVVAEGAGSGTPAPPPSSVICALLRTSTARLGVLHLHRRSDQPQFTEQDLQLVDALAASVSSIIENVRCLLQRERDLLVRTLTALAQAVDLRDDYTGSHTQRVTDYSLMLAGVLGLDATEQHHLRIGTPLHDIGKIGISDYILRKPGPLTIEEVEYMKSHTVKGSAMIEIIPHLAPVIPIVRSHHERWDGSGYPDGLCGERIPILARIVGVADAFDAMTTDRPYRSSLPLDKAFAQIEQASGRQFDPDCAAAFLQLRGQLEERMWQANQICKTATRNEVLRALQGCQPPSSRRRTESLPNPRVADMKRHATAT